MRVAIFGFVLGVIAVFGANSPALAQAPTPPDLSPVNNGPYGIEAKRPVIAAACKACPWGSVALAVKEAMKPLGYDVQICHICSRTTGPGYVADKTVPVVMASTLANTDIWHLVDRPPNAVPDFGVISLGFLGQAWNGTGEFAVDKKQRHNLRVIAVLGAARHVHPAEFYGVAINKKSGITNLAQVKDRTQPTWIHANVRFTDQDKEVLAYYGITEEALKAHGGGFITSSIRERVIASDVYIGPIELINTPEGRMWYIATQVNDLTFVDLPQDLIAQLEKRPGIKAGYIPAGFVRGIERAVPSVMIVGTDATWGIGQSVYTREEIPDSFAYDVAKALDQNQEVLRYQMVPALYDAHTVAISPVVPIHPGALKYYRERGYVK